MQNQKIKRDFPVAQETRKVHPRPSARATFVQKNLAQLNPHLFLTALININHHSNHHLFLRHRFFEVQFELICGYYKHRL